MEKIIVSNNWQENNILIKKEAAKLSEIDQLKLELRRKEVELAIYKNTRNRKGTVASSSCKVSGRIER